jgi:hypothetical protein
MAAVHMVTGKGEQKMTVEHTAQNSQSRKHDANDRDDS